MALTKTEVEKWQVVAMGYFDKAGIVLTDE